MKAEKTKADIFSTIASPMAQVGARSATAICAQKGSRVRDHDGLLWREQMGLLWKLAAVVLAIVFSGVALGEEKAKPPQPAQAQAPKKSQPAASEQSFGKALSLAGVSREEARDIFDEIALHIIYDMNYSEKNPTGRSSSSVKGNQRETRWKMADGESDVHARFFQKDMPSSDKPEDSDNSYRTIEVGVKEIGNGNGNSYLLSYGKEVKGEAEAPNPELTQVYAKVQELITNLTKEKSAKKGKDHEVEVYQLHYTRADRAVATLKVLGYNVIEFTGTPGANPLEKIYSAQGGVKTDELPVIMKFIDADNTSLPTAKSPSPGRGLTPDLGGGALQNVTTTDELQRLLIIYDESKPEQYNELVRMLKEKIDVAARQILIEAMVMEVAVDKLPQLTGGYGSSNEGDMLFQMAFPQQQMLLPFVTDFGNAVRTTQEKFKRELTLLMKDGYADLLSKPSVIAVDGRQARIRVGQDIPVATRTIKGNAISITTNYFPIGIVMNIKPRIGADAKEVSMQIEAVVSEVSDEGLTFQDRTPSAGAPIAPKVDTRHVQTSARVPDGTPFIIGGLIAHKEHEVTHRLPFISHTPLIGEKVFTRKSLIKEKTEVIIILTPHILPQHGTTADYLMPKNSDLFDSFDNKLFRNSYRIRTDDVFDLAFLEDNQEFKELVAEIKRRAEEDPKLAKSPVIINCLEGNIPGESCLAMGTLYEIVKKRKLEDKLPTANIVMLKEKFEGSGRFEMVTLKDELGSVGRKPFLRLPGHRDKVLRISYSVHPARNVEDTVRRPLAQISKVKVKDKEEYSELLEKENGMDPETEEATWTILLRTQDDIKKLKHCLIVKEVMRMNDKQAVSHLKNLSAGKVLFFPDFNPEEEWTVLVDAKVARLFYECDKCYSVFEDEFDREIKKVKAELTVYSRLSGL